MNSNSRNLQHLLLDIVISENNEKERDQLDWGLVDSFLFLFYISAVRSVVEHSCVGFGHPIENEVSRVRFPYCRIHQIIFERVLNYE